MSAKLPSIIIFTQVKGWQLLGIEVTRLLQQLECPSTSYKKQQTRNTHPFQSFHRKQNKTKKAKEQNKTKTRTVGKSDQLIQPKNALLSRKHWHALQPSKNGVLPIEETETKLLQGHVGLLFERSYTLALLSPLSTRTLALYSRKTQVEITSKGFLMTWRNFNGMPTVSLISLKITNFSGFSVSSMVVPPPFLSPMTYREKQQVNQIVAVNVNCYHFCFLQRVQSWKTDQH